MNVILSVLLVKRIGVVGVIVATVITNLMICHVIEPYVLFRHAFHVSPGKYYLRNYGMIFSFGAALLLTSCCLRHSESQWFAFVMNGFISVGISLCICLPVLLFNKDFLIHFFRKGKPRDE